ncbi:MAG TPA: hypothetical protein DG942_02085 [Ruminococcaceae bacterium]|nr:hypothetical protein [Oscillospiraceae bacterium]
MVNEIALTNLPNQTYSLEIPGDNHNITFIITQSWNEQAGYWTISIYNQESEPLVLGIPLLCGHDLLEQYQYLKIGSLYLINIGDPTIENPDANNIGQNFKLLWELE